jgi:hypothetical protein
LSCRWYMGWESSQYFAGPPSVTVSPSIIPIVYDHIQNKHLLMSSCKLFIS